MAQLKTNNIKKLRNLVIFLILIFVIFLFFLNFKHSYTLKYKINDIDVTEKYHKKEKYYSFLISYEGKDYELISFDKYTSKRKLINDIKVDNKEESTCLSFVSNKISLYDVCSNEDSFYYPHEEKEFKENSNYKNIKINTLNNKTYFLWNYHEFIYLNAKKNTNIKLFDKDIYKLNLIYQSDKYLVVPNYDENYKFTKIYLLNKENGKTKEVNLRYEIYFDSYFLGNYKNKVYLYDYKSELEYYFDLKKYDIYKTKYQINNNGKWESVTNQKLKNNKLTFTKDKVFNYSLKKDKLYANDKYLVTNLSVNKIIKADNLDVYYISKDTLYYFNPMQGVIPLLKYSEWEFNNTNMIFIF